MLPALRIANLVTACALLTSTGCERERDRARPLAAIAKACGKDAELSCPRPIFSVRELRKSQAYYRDALGFRIDWEHGDPPEFGSVSRADATLFMCQQCQGTPGAWMMVFARDVDRLHAEFIERKAIITMPPTDMPWGIRELHVADPDGNVLRFGSSIEH